MASRHAHIRRVTLWIGAAALIGSTGCVERRYTIRTDPPGALAIVNGEEVGRTPVSRNFTYYGDRDITLMMDGYQTQRRIQKINAPWYDNHLTEFFTENVVPVTLRDERDYTYKMEPGQTPTTNALVGNAEALRSQARVTPPPRRGGILGFFGF